MFAMRAIEIIWRATVWEADPIRGKRKRKISVGGNATETKTISRSHLNLWGLKRWLSKLWLFWFFHLRRVRRRCWCWRIPRRLEREEKCNLMISKRGKSHCKHSRKERKEIRRKQKERDGKKRMLEQERIEHRAADNLTFWIRLTFFLHQSDVRSFIQFRDSLPLCYTQYSLISIPTIFLFGEWSAPPTLIIPTLSTFFMFDVSNGTIPER